MPSEREMQIYPSNIGSDDAGVYVKMADDAGNTYEMRLQTIDVATLMGSLSVAVQAFAGSPQAREGTMPGVQRLQYEETAETVFLRVFLGPHLYHEYPVQKGTTVANDILALCEMAERRILAKATHPQDGGEKKH